MPATAAGGSAVWSQQLSDSHRLVGGIDLGWIEGETNEHFLRVDDAFTRSRRAGGQQFFTGAFLEENWTVSEAVKVTAGARLDYWRQYDGTRLEPDRRTGATLRADDFATQDGLEPNGRLGISAQITPATRARAAAYTGFRAPTLNELYRPFRVGNDITEANPALETERLYGGEFGFDWEPGDRFSISATTFYNQLHDAVGNVTIGEGPGTFDPGGFVPAGGVLRQRRNLDSVEVFGFETKAVWRLAEDWQLRAQYLYTHPVIGSAAESPQLEGKRLAQAPDHIALAALDWTPGRWQATAQIRSTGRQYEDDLNTLPLTPFTTVDLSLTYGFNDHLTGTFKIENLLNTESEVGKTTSSLVSTGTPRLVSLTFGMNF